MIAPAAPSAESGGAPAPGVPAPVPASVLHVAHQVRPHVGGIETVVAAETQGLRERGWRVAVATSADTLRPGTREEDGVRVTRMRSWNGLEDRFGVPFPFFSPLALLRLGRLVRRADVVHLHDVLYLSSWVAAAWCLVHRRPYVVTRHVGVVHHSSAVVRLVQWAVLATVARVILARAAAVLPIDERIAAQVRAGVPDPARVQVMGNGVDTARFEPGTTATRDQVRTEHRLPLDRPLALFVGRSVPKKGFDVVAAAAGDDYDIAFVGGEQPEGVSHPHLHFVGAVGAADMPGIYGCADVMVIASVGECPLTVLEAMSTGLPVLANDDPALHSPWTAGGGVEFVDMAGGGLPEALRTLLGNPPHLRALGTAGRAHVATSFSWDAHVDQLATVYAGALAPSRRTR